MSRSQTSGLLSLAVLLTCFNLTLADEPAEILGAPHGMRPMDPSGGGVGRIHPTPNAPDQQMHSNSMFANDCGCSPAPCPQPFPCPTSCRPLNPCRPCTSRITTPRRRIQIEMPPPEIVVRAKCNQNNARGGLLRLCGHFFKSRTVSWGHGHTPRPQFAPMMIQPQAIAPTYIQPQAVAPTIVQPQAIAPTYVQPQAIAPTYIQPQAVAPTYIQPQAIAPTYIQPQAVAPAVVQPQAIAPTYIQPQSVVATAVQPQSLTTAVIQPQSLQVTPQATQPMQVLLVSPQSIRPHSTQDDPIKPQSTGEDDLNKELQKLANGLKLLSTTVDRQTTIIYQNRLLIEGLIGHAVDQNKQEAFLKKVRDRYKSRPKLENLFPDN